jgi:predicted regulator of Ras-like GTPase activity (Roadblock/LC7/MglB family)
MQSSLAPEILQKVEEILADVVNKEPSISSAAVMSPEGFPLVVQMAKEENAKIELAAAIASLGSLSEQTAERLKIGQYQDLVLRCGNGHLLVRRIGLVGMLAVITEHNAHLGACYMILDFLEKNLEIML